MIGYILLFALVLVVLRCVSLKIQAEVGQDLGQCTWILKPCCS
jgi:hypothetical protein